MPEISDDELARIVATAKAEAQATADATVSNWTFDVQRGLAWTVMLMFAIVTMAMAMRTAVTAEISDINDLLKSSLAVLFNIVMLVLGYFFGSSKSSQAKDETQNKIMEKLTSTS